jgi:hypothetical protein
VRIGIDPFRVRTAHPRRHLASTVGTGNRASARRYTIKLRGAAGAAVIAAFPEFSVSIRDDTTELRGTIEDQAALHGVLQRIQDLGLVILEVVRTPPESDA